MCCNHGLISRIPTTPPPLVSPHIHTLTPPIIRLSLTSKSYKTKSLIITTTASAVKDGGAAVSETITDELSFYELLGIPETVSLVEIKQAYKQLARKYHPDVSPPGRVEEYTQKFIRVQEAYETLSDPSLRALYDKDMALGVHFAFGSRNCLKKNMEKGEWRGQWESQLSELRKRSMHKESGNNTSWAARMRRERKQSSS
ncbi:hypothetical protein M8C21_015623 [Ambrosia artemisiifolia]|uniref:J domain-containing protein n=1 Tax=Ambrosia artemisiifolia TaxID=4212 RepID=A0AAD5D820_AMBAR|nr:hypothetical protein M8C21_015623 [Ambrosia artemisiifolia]